MECMVCASELPDGSAFCLVCGSPQNPPPTPTISTEPVCARCGQVLPADSAFCLRCGAAVRRDEEVVVPSVVAASTERRVTTVLFADLVEHTSRSETRDSEDVRDLLSAYFEVCSTIVRRYGGTVEKFIGDAVMAVWGVPTSHEDDAERAVRAGLELVTGVTALGERLALPELSLRVGIVTGEVAATLAATDQGIVAGDPVNTAARVQATAGPGEVWVDPTTRTLTAAAVTYFDAGQHALKGKADPIHLFRAGAIVAARSGGQRLDGLEAALVGRERPLRLLKELFHGTRESGRPSLVVLDGEAGVGKSRLGWELEKYVDRPESSVVWLRGRCLSYGDGVAFWALSEAVRARLGLVDGDPSAIVLAALDQALAGNVPDEGQRAWLRPRVASLLGEESREFAREDLFAAWTDFLERVGGGDPVVLLIDDAHHADQGLLDFVQHAVANARFALFVLVLARPELLEANPALGGRRATVLRLERLPDPALLQLVGDLVDGLEDAAAQSLVRRAEGLPLFAVETVRALIDRGDVGPVEGRYVVMPGRTIDLETMGAPASMHALVAARLDALTPAERRVLTDASVLGESFTREAIGILARDVPDLDGVLESLQRRELVVTDHDPHSAERGQLRFVHGMVRQVAYSTLARSERKARHLLVADHLLSEPARSDELAQIIARHLLDAADISGPGDQDVAALRERASTLLVTAGTRACALGAYADGLRSFHAALEIVDEGRARAEVLSRAAAAAVRVLQYELATADAEQAIELFDKAGDVVAAADAACHLAKALGELGRHDEAAALATKRLETVVDTAGSELLVARLSRIAAEYLQFQGKAREAAPFVDTALQMSDLAEDAETFVGAVHLLAVQQLLLGSARVSRLLFAGMAEVSRRAELWSARTSALANEASLLASRDLDRAIDLMREAADNQAEHGLPRHLTNEANLCTWYWMSGRWEELDDLLGTSAVASGDTVLMAKAASGADQLLVWSGLRDHRLVERFPGEEAPTPGLHPVELYRRLCAELAHGDRTRAAALAHDLVAAELEQSSVTDDLHAYWPLAVRAALEGEGPQALAALLALVSPYADRAMPLALRSQLRIARRQLEMFSETPDDEGIVADLEQGIDELAEAGSVVWEAHAHEDLARWHLTQGRQAEAEPHLDAARATYAALGARRWLARLDALA